MESGCNSNASANSGKFLTAIVPSCSGDPKQCTGRDRESGETATQSHAERGQKSSNKHSVSEVCTRLPTRRVARGRAEREVEKPTNQKNVSVEILTGTINIDAITLAIAYWLPRSLRARGRSSPGWDQTPRSRKPRSRTCACTSTFHPQPGRHPSCRPCCR